MECLGSACTLGGSNPLLVRQMLSFSLTGCSFLWVWMFLGIKKWNVSGVLALSGARTCGPQSSFLFNMSLFKIIVSGQILG